MAYISFEKSSMRSSVAGIMDLPDEIIIKIWNNLNNIDVLCSFIGVNKRFDKLVRDPFYTRSIQLTENDPKTNKYYSLPDSTINRYCSDILPQIHQCIECLILESSSMERILLSCHYPHLHKLIFTKIDGDFVLRHCVGNIYIFSLNFENKYYLSHR